MSHAEISAKLSPCGTYRWTLTRHWDAQPMLVVVLFNPSTADHREDDPTIKLLCQIAKHNLYGGILVVNAIPLRSSTPAAAIDFANWDKGGINDWHARDRLQDNLDEIVKAVHSAGAVLLAWGALGERCSDWMDLVLDEVRAAVPPHGELYCLGKTAKGHPKHPMARGKHKVRPDALLFPWTR